MTDEIVGPDGPNEQTDCTCAPLGAASKSHSKLPLRCALSPPDQPEYEVLAEHMHTLRALDQLSNLVCDGVDLSDLLQLVNTKVQDTSLGLYRFIQL